ncbi:FAD-dependent oxidoreductase [Nakamurella endophytica]|uniref:Pyridine nucleotide-disulphide oxidoreductase n=1 Tax=Nakamurella endophytica TaxID=1748367 RepID=A0A917WK45_9ACTN|nr:FAD-dependent oxidoreductase [Nakamurella endophytica]GGM09878.1 putative pyridine nucleotide-disulphide oxidoreductase [Nakamurella endophytica]
MANRHLVAIGGRDAGISAALRARELEPGVDVTVVVADAYPNFSICGIPYHLSGDVPDWRDLAHRTVADLQATGMRLALDTRAERIDVAEQRVLLTSAGGQQSWLSYDELVVGTGAVPTRSRIGGFTGPDALGPADGVHVLHTMGDTFALAGDLAQQPETALIVGAGYVGLEMAEALTARGITVTQVQRGPQVLSTLDEPLGALVRDELTAHGVEVVTGTTITAIARARASTGGRVTVTGRRDGTPFTRTVDVVLVVVGVRPDTDLLVSAGAVTGAGGAVVVDEAMRTGLPHVYAAGDCVTTHHRLLGVTYLPLGTTAHKQGKVAGTNAVGGSARFTGSVGTQVVKVFDLVAARTGLRHDEAARAGFHPATTQTTADDHKAYYPGAHRIAIRVTGDTRDSRLLGAQLVGRRGSEIAKRVDTYATALYAGMTVPDLDALDLSYTPPLGSPWDAVQMAGHAWTREHHQPAPQPAGALVTT